MSPVLIGGASEFAANHTLIAAPLLPFPNVGKGDAQARQHIAELTALGRLGEAEDIGLFVAALLSEDSRFLNAQRIELSGGISL